MYTNFPATCILPYPHRSARLTTMSSDTILPCFDLLLQIWGWESCSWRWDDMKLHSHIVKKTSYLFRRHSLSSMTLDLTDIQRMCELRCVNFTCRNTSWLCLNTWFHHVRKENENSMQLRVMMIAYVTGVDMAITCNYCVPFLTHAGIQDERTRALAAQAFLGG